MSPFTVRLGTAAGWLSFAGIALVLHIIPMALAGQPPVSSTEPSAVLAYFSHPDLAILGLAGAFIGFGLIPFGLGLRSALLSSADERVRTIADIGFGALLVTVVLYVISEALAAVLVEAAARGTTELATIFRFYDVLYNGVAQVLEGAWVGAFSIAMLGGALPRWIAWLGIIVGASSWLIAAAPFVAVPSAIVTVGGVLIFVWFVATLVALTRIALRSAPAPALSTAPAV